MPKVEIRLEGLTKKFHDVVAVDGLSLEVEKGKLYSLLGPSGCGKTTTLRMVAGFEHPTHGDVYMGEKKVTHVPPYERNLGMFFQNYALFPHMNVFENVAFGLKMRGLSQSIIEKKVKDALAMVQLSVYEKRRMKELSGGEQQRVALARSLIIEPTALLLDEPLSSLDKNLREEMQIQLRSLQRELKITTVFVTHNQQEALVLSDRVVVMDKGKIQQVGTPREIYYRPKSRFVADFIGTANIAEGELISSDNLYSVVNLRNGLQIRSGVRSIGKGKVTLILRPESLNILPSGSTDTPNVFSGTLENTVFFGSTVRYFVRLPSNDLFVVDEYGDSRIKDILQVGDRVLLSYDPENCWLIQG